MSDVSPYGLIMDNTINLLSKQLNPSAEDIEFLELLKRDRLQDELRKEARRKDHVDNINKSFIFKLDVPSGKIVFDNDFRDIVDADESVNVVADEGMHFSWCMGFSRAYEQLKMIHMFVGNTCPSIYKKDNTLIINPDIEYDEEIDEPIIPKRYDRVGSICTDLWWWSAMDYDHFKSFNNDISDSVLTIVEMIPGTYNVIATFNEHGHFESRFEL